MQTLLLKALSLIYLSFSKSCSCEPGSGCTTNWSWGAVEEAWLCCCSWWWGLGEGGEGLGAGGGPGPPRPPGGPVGGGGGGVILLPPGADSVAAWDRSLYLMKEII